jgi:hypothetical protein
MSIKYTVSYHGGYNMENVYSKVAAYALKSILCLFMVVSLVIPSSLCAARMRKVTPAQRAQAARSAHQVKKPRQKQADSDKKSKVHIQKKKSEWTWQRIAQYAVGGAILGWLAYYNRYELIIALLGGGFLLRETIVVGQAPNNQQQCRGAHRDVQIVGGNVVVEQAVVGQQHGAQCAQNSLKNVDDVLKALNGNNHNGNNQNLQEQLNGQGQIGEWNREIIQERARLNDQIRAENERRQNEEGYQQRPLLDVDGANWLDDQEVQWLIHQYNLGNIVVCSAPALLGEDADAVIPALLGNPDFNEDGLLNAPPYRCGVILGNMDHNRNDYRRMGSRGHWVGVVIQVENHGQPNECRKYLAMDSSGNNLVLHPETNEIRNQALQQLITAVENHHRARNPRL